MPDPFNVDSIRRSVPQVKDTLELESVRNILEELDHVPMEVDVIDKVAEPTAELADVSMHDAPNETIDQLPPSPVKPQDPEPSDSEKESELDNEVADGNTSLSLAPTILSPTQMGAKQAMDQFPTMEVKLPIPAPWHHNLPYILSTYLQLAFNLALLFIAYLLVRTFKTDVDKHMLEKSASIARKASQCAELYIENKCRPGTRSPALEEYCADLEECMDRDPEAVRRMTAHAATLAEIINGLIDPLSFKSIFIIIFIGIVVTFAANYFFGFVRARTYYGPSHPPQLESESASYRVTPISAQSKDIWKH